MNVFISWSGEQSKALAEAIRKWLPNVIQAVEPFYSPEDVKAGTRWSSEIAKKLEETEIGIICLTGDNLDAPWLMFEAGALSKQLEARVCPILFRLKPTDLQGPLTQFQLNEFTHEGMYNVLLSINEQLRSDCLSVETLKNAYEKWWPELDATLTQVLSKYGTVGIKSTRTERDLLEEILIRMRTYVGESPIDPDMTHMLIYCYGQLADLIRYIANKEKRDAAAHSLWNLQFPIQYFITRVGDTNKRRELAQGYADAVSVYFQGSGHVDRDKLIQNLIHPSHGLIIPAPVIPKQKQD